ncbi:MAG: cysteine desulfurase [Ignavibacteria bacterium]|nr:cysteine desulfurase [Ignavibacteria bacterium]
MDRIYLDNASTTETDGRVLEAMMPYLTGKFGNASSIHSLGKTAKVMLEDTRDIVAEAIGCSSSEIFFTSGGTESNNFALKGMAFSRIGKGGHIVSSLAEHSAVLDTLKYLESRFGFDVTYLAPGGRGNIDPDRVRSAVREDTFLISLMHANNETGALTDVRAVSGIASGYGIAFHSDTVQSFGKLNLNVKELGMDMAVISAHKISGPKGISALYIKKGTKPDKYMHGGMQERDMRGGTENTAAIAGFGKAVLICRDQAGRDFEHYTELRRHLLGLLLSEFGNALSVNSPEDESKGLPNILNFSFRKELAEYDEEMLLIQLDLKGIAVSGGSACTSGTNKPSHVLLAIGRDPAEALGAVRVSFGRNNTKSDCEGLLKALKEIVRLK